MVYEQLYVGYVNSFQPVAIYVRVGPTAQRSLGKIDVVNQYRDIREIDFAVRATVDITRYTFVVYTTAGAVGRIKAIIGAQNSDGVAKEIGRCDKPVSVGV